MMNLSQTIVIVTVLVNVKQKSANRMSLMEPTSSLDDLGDVVLRVKNDMVLHKPADALLLNNQPIHSTADDGDLRVIGVPIARDSFVHRSFHGRSQLLLQATKQSQRVTVIGSMTHKQSHCDDHQDAGTVLTDCRPMSLSPHHLPFKRDFMRHSMNVAPPPMKRDFLRHSVSSFIRSISKATHSSKQHSSDSDNNCGGNAKPKCKETFRANGCKETKEKDANNNATNKLQSANAPHEGGDNNSGTVVADAIAKLSLILPRVDSKKLLKNGGHKRNSSSSSCASNRSTNSVGLGIRSAPSTPMAPLQGQSDGQSVGGVNFLSRSPSHHSTKNDSKSAKQLTTITPTNARTPSPHPTKSGKSDVPEKEKKRKEMSSSRQKKFHRHFQQVDSDERVINYFSCALVSDILLQGHLYITDNYFAFYSNVFGFVTKLLIPTVSVVKISKEKTAKIIPNAVGVATTDERHVFASFMSREAAYRLMLSVWRPVEPEIIPKIPDVEISECSIEDESSCSISGNESPPQQLNSTVDGSTVVKLRTIVPTAVDGFVRAISEVEIPIVKIPEPFVKQQSPQSSQASVIHKPTVSSPPKLVSVYNFLQFIKLPSNIHIIYIGVVLSVILSIFSGFLLYKILDIQTKPAPFSPLDFKWGGTRDMDVYADVLRWQKEMQTKSVEEAQIILNSNLEQIARVRKSLETLSILIHDKNSHHMSHTSTGNAMDDFAGSNDPHMEHITGAIGQT